LTELADQDESPLEELPLAELADALALGGRIQEIRGGRGIGRKQRFDLEAHGLVVGAGVFEEAAALAARELHRVMEKILDALAPFVDHDANEYRRGPWVG
jgi:hypothetical protein